MSGIMPHLALQNNFKMHAGTCTFTYARTHNTHEDTQVQFPLLNNAFVVHASSVLVVCASSTRPDLPGATEVEYGFDTPVRFGRHELAATER